MVFPNDPGVHTYVELVHNSSDAAANVGQVQWVFRDNQSTFTHSTRSTPAWAFSESKIPRCLRPLQTQTQPILAARCRMPRRTCTASRIYPRCVRPDLRHQVRFCGIRISPPGAWDVRPGLIRGDLWGVDRVAEAGDAGRRANQARPLLHWQHRHDRGILQPRGQQSHPQHSSGRDVQPLVWAVLHPCQCTWPGIQPVRHHAGIAGRYVCRCDLR